jgi:hypothetical protein
MPKELYELNRFDSGTMTTPDVRDIPPEAASYSLNLDSITEDGVVKGIPNDATAQSNAGGVTDHNCASWLDKGDGTKDLVTFGLAAGAKKIQVWENFHSGTSVTPSATTISPTPSAGATMQSNNRAVHVGLGNTATDAPKWVGYIDHAQFGLTTDQDSLQVQDAELKRPDAVPLAHAHVSDGTYSYVIEWKGSRVWKYTDASLGNGVTLKGPNVFTTATAMCEHPDTDYLFVFDAGIGTYGTLHKVAKATLDISASYPIAGWHEADEGLMSNAVISDMIVTDPGSGNHMWFAAYRSQAVTTESTDKFLFYFDSDSLASGTSFTPANKQFSLTSGNNITGQFVNEPSVKLYKRSLARWRNGDGEVAAFVFNNSGVSIKTPDSTYAPKIMVLLIDKDAVQSSYMNLDSTIRAFFLIEYNLSNWGAAFLDRKTKSVEMWGSGTASEERLLLTFQAGIGGVNTVLYAIDPSQIPAMNASAATWWPTEAGTQKPFKAINENYSGSNNVVSGGFSSTLSIVSYSSSVYTLVGFHTTKLGGNLTFTYNKTTPAYSVVTRQDVGSVALALTSISDSGTIGQNDITTFQFYKISYVYDGYQESPLSETISYQELGDENYAIQIDIKVDIDDVGKRVSAINVYRARALASSVPTSFFRLVKTLDLDDKWTLISSSSDPYHKAMGNHRSFGIIDSGTVGAGYEARTGVSEILENSMVNYGISTKIHGQHVVGLCYHPDVDHSELYLFKSQPGDFDRFNWLDDYLKLPSKPTAIASFQGRIYAWDGNTTYRINPEGFYIEDTFDGVGCMNQNCHVVTEYGMAFADKNNIYLHDGRNPKPIGEPILRDSANSMGWQDKITTDIDPMVTFDAVRNSILVFFQASVQLAPSTESTWDQGDKYSGIWSYNIPRKRWDLYMTNDKTMETGIDYASYVLSGKDGYVLMLLKGADEGEMRWLMKGTGYRKWFYRTKKINMGVSTQKKMLYGIHWVGGASVRYQFEDGDYSNADTSTPITFTGSGLARKKRDLTIEASSAHAEYTDKMNALSIVFRRLPVNQTTLVD